MESLERADILHRFGTNARIVFVSGNFNVLHPGHLRLLKFARECGDVLVVGVNARSTTLVSSLPAEMRLEAVKSISLVDYALLLHQTPSEFIAHLRPDVVVKGKEFESRDNPETEVLATFGGKLLFSSGEMRFSSLDLLHREYFESNYSSIRKPTEYAERHAFSVPELKRVLPRMNGIKALVIGDLIIDEYITCDPLGMSQEDPTIVVTPIENKRFIGGAGIVAAHAVGLGATVRYFSVAGKDEVAEYADAKLRAYGVDAVLVPDESRPTTLKQRFRASGKTLLRVSHLRQHDISPEIAKVLLSSIEAFIKDTELVIFSDFNYGCLPQYLVDRVIELCGKHGVTMVADSQASSQISDVSRFTGMKLITPTEREARLALRDNTSGLAVLAESLREKARAENVAITLGAEGLLVLSKDGSQWMTDRLPAFNTSPKDAAGAGDSFLACAALGLCAGLDSWQSIYLGALAAACQVGRVGNTPLSQADLVAEIDYQ